MVANILVYFGIVPFTGYFIYFGYPGLYKILGGSFALFLVYPLALYSYSRYQEYRRLVWYLLYNMAGIVLFNHLYVFVRDYDIKLDLIATMFMLTIPISFLISGTLRGVDGLLKPGLREEHGDYSRFVKYYMWVLTIAFCSIPLIEDYSIKGNRAVGVLLAMSSLVVASLIILIENSRITAEQREYLSEPVIRMNIGRSKAAVYLAMFIGLFLFLSSYFETYRGEWLLWIVSASSFVIQLLLQFFSARFIFEPESQFDLSIISFDGLPSRKDARSIIVGVVIFGMYFVYVADVLGK